MLLLTLLACATATSPTPPQAPAPAFSLPGLALPLTPADAPQTQLPYTELLRVDQRLGSSPPFGAVLDQAGAPMPRVVNARLPDWPHCLGLDYSGLLSRGDGLWLFSHFECPRGQLQLSRLDQSSTGALSPAATEPVDAAAIGGVWNPCAAVITPWGSALSGEEYEPDARGWDPLTGQITKEYDDFDAWPAMTRAFPAPTDAYPYHYGGITELLFTGPTHTLVRHHTLGRYSHEVAHVLSDHKTVYLSDDGKNGGLFLFIADRPDDLTAGHLYAARVEAEGDAERSALPLSWVPLGHATAAQLTPLLAARVRFDELFDAAQPDATGACTDGRSKLRTRVRSGGTHWECLKLAQPSERVPDPALAASRLETRRYAALLGATVEFNKGEGITSDPTTGRVYVAMSDIGKGMLAEPDAPPGTDHLRLNPNRCGVVYGGPTEAGQTDHNGAPMPSALVLRKLTPVLWGSPEGEKGCAADALAHPDNLAFAPEHGVLFVAEDSGAHEVDLLWAKRADEPPVALLGAPQDAEVTGITWAANLGGYAYLTVVFQKPFTATDRSETAWRTADRRASQVGYLGPFAPSLPPTN